jgi:hypothetical protein
VPALPAIILSQPRLLVATHGALLISVVNGETPPEEMDLLAAEMRGAARRSVTGMAFLFVVSSGAHHPSGAVRQRYVQALKDIQPKLKAFAAVIEGSGFATATKRSIFTMLTSHFLGKVPLKVFADTSSACAWLTKQSEVKSLELPTTATLTAFIASLPPTTPG